MPRHPLILEGVDQPLWRGDFMKHAAEGVFAAVWLTVDKAPDTAHLRFEFVHYGAGSARPPPSRYQRRVGERFKDQFARRVELARHANLVFPRLGDQIMLLQHRCSPLLAVRPASHPD